jgi:hypothetical protein
MQYYHKCNKHIIIYNSLKNVHRKSRKPKKFVKIFLTLNLCYLAICMENNELKYVNVKCK